MWTLSLKKWKTFNECLKVDGEPPGFPYIVIVLTVSRFEAPWFLDSRFVRVRSRACIELP